MASWETSPTNQGARISSNSIDSVFYLYRVKGILEGVEVLISGQNRVDSIGIDKRNMYLE